MRFSSRKPVKMVESPAVVGRRDRLSRPPGAQPVLELKGRCAKASAAIGLTESGLGFNLQISGLF